MHATGRGEKEKKETRGKLYKGYKLFIASSQKVHINWNCHFQPTDNLCERHCGVMWTKI